MDRLYRSTADHLIVREHPWGLRFVALWFGAFGLVFVLGGLGFFESAQPPDAVTAVVITLLGGLALVCFPLVWTRARDRRVTVDQAQAQVRVEVRAGPDRGQRQIRFAKVKAVEVAERRDDDGDRVFRAELVLRDGSRVPLREGWVVKRARADDLAEAARARVLG